jgi:hypothetical protein
MHETQWERRRMDREERNQDGGEGFLTAKIDEWGNGEGHVILAYLVSSTTVTQNDAAVKVLVSSMAGVVAGIPEIVVY